MLRRWTGLLSNITGLQPWKHVVWRVKRRLADHALILMYHRVTDLPCDPQLLAVRPKHFAEQLEVIRQHGRPMRLSQLVKALQSGKTPNRAVVVTFDDGYADNLHYARPLLERYEIPATVFVTAGHVGNQQEFWWDELDRLLLQPGVLPGRLSLHLNGSVAEWDLGAGNVYTEEDYRRNQDWHVERLADPGPRQYLYRSLYDRLYSLSPAERQKALEELQMWAGIGSTGRPTHRTLTSSQLIQLDTGELIEVGAHTMSHPALAALPVAAQQNEIRRSKAHLEGILNHPVWSFAYPYGSIAAETLAIVRAAGFTCACFSNPDAVWRDADLFQLPRLVVRDWDGDTFARWLRWWIGG